MWYPLGSTIRCGRVPLRSSRVFLSILEDFAAHYLSTDFDIPLTCAVSSMEPCAIELRSCHEVVGTCIQLVPTFRKCPPNLKDFKLKTSIPHGNKDALDNAEDLKGLPTVGSPTIIKARVIYLQAKDKVSFLL